MKLLPVTDKSLITFTISALFATLSGPDLGTMGGTRQTADTSTFFLICISHFVPAYSFVMLSSPLIVKINVNSLLAYYPSGEHSKHYNGQGSKGEMKTEAKS